MNRLALPAILTSLCVAMSSAARGQERITVHELIREAKFGDPAHVIFDSAHRRAPAIVSPDRLKAAVIVRAGDIVSESHVGRLLLYRNGAMDRPPALVAEFHSKSNYQPISMARWLGDSRTLVFVGAEGETAPQVFAVKIDGGRPRALSSDPALSYFSISANGQRLITQSSAVRSPPDDDPQCQAFGCRVTGGSLFDAQLGWSAGTPLTTSYDLKTGTKVIIQATEAVDPTFESCPRGPVGEVSPDGRYSLRVCSLRRDKVPSSWLQLTQMSNFMGDDSWRSDPYVLQDMFGAGHLFLIDLERGQSTPLLETPFVMYSARTLWVDEGHVILAGVFPPEDSDGRIDRHRASILMADVASGKFTVLGVLPREFRAVTQLAYDRSAQRLSVRWMDIHKEQFAFALRRQGKTWRNEAVADSKLPRAIERLADGSELKVEQSLEEPEQLVVIDGVKRERRVLLAPNDWLKQKALGRVEAVKWPIGGGRIWPGGLIFPPNYVPGKRYPLLLQTHGFNPNRFDLAGNSHNYPGQAMAARGVLVLLVDDNDTNGKRGDGIAEWTSIQAAYESAIEYLDDRGLIDPQKVGIVGWSRSGMYTTYALTHSSQKFAAAALTSSGGFGYWFYLATAPELQREFDMDYEAPPFGPGLEAWRQHSPGFNLDRARAPTLLWSEGSIAPMWDWYSAMRRLGVPTEYWFLPKGAHELSDVRQRRKTVGLLVDWFDFWLQGHEDPAADKADQYARWNAMKSDWMRSGNP